MNNGIEINLTGSYQAGRCFWKYSYEVTSSRPLDSKAFYTLRELGFLPNGQGFGFCQVTSDGSTVTVPEELSWKNRPKPTSETRTDNPDRTCTITTSYVYRVAIEIDSGD